MVKGFAGFIMISLATCLHAESPLIQYTKQSHQYHLSVSHQFETSKTVEEATAFLLNFDRINQISPNIESSTILSSTHEHAIVKTVFRNCLFFFCKKAIVTEKISSSCADQHGAKSCLIHSESYGHNDDISESLTQWEIKPTVSGSIIAYQSEFDVTFKIPSFIGGRLIASNIKKDLLRLETAMQQ